MKYEDAIQVFKARFESGENPTVLMNDMERTFQIPMHNNHDFNLKNSAAIELYRKISDSRNLFEIDNDGCYKCDVCAAKESCEKSPFYWDGESPKY